MIVNRKWLWPLLAGVAALQSAAVFGMIYEHHRFLKTGREITLAVRPLDPRDIFRGDYVTLGYDISAITKPGAEMDQEYKDAAVDENAYVTLSPKPEGGWTASHVGRVYPARVAPGDIVLKGRVLTFWKSKDPATTTLSIRYGIERYFVPEGTGRALEDKVRDHKIEAIVAVGPDGTSALKGLVVDGERHEDPPLL